MAVAGTLDKLVWGGTLCGTEEWSCSVHLVHPGPADETAPLAAMKTLVADWFQSGQLYTNTGATFNYVKWNAINPATGRYLDPNNSNTLEFNPILPSSGAVNFAPQLSAAVSLQSANSRGLASKGRFYPPAIGGQPGPTGHNNTADVANYLSTNLTLIRGFNALISGGKVSIFSPTGQIAQEVTAVRIGDVVDTQRRRRKSLVEKYSSFAV